MMKVLATAVLLPGLDFLYNEADAQGLTPLDSKDSAASALGFVTDASAAKANPLYKSGAHCASCVQFLGKPTDAMAGCKIYAGHSVPANGWCMVWSQRPG
jgi:hypothetical protein